MISRIIDYFKSLYWSLKGLSIITTILGVGFSLATKDWFTGLVFSGKSFSGRNLPAKILILVFLFLFFLTIIQLIIKSFQRNPRLDMKILHLENQVFKFEKYIWRILTSQGGYRVILFLCICLFFVGLVNLLWSINPSANDDAFIYYNYARNFIEGRPFAYDVRNLPSEGFTSLLFLFLLLPFEYFKINMLFAALLINLMAIIGGIFVAVLTVWKSKFLSRVSSLLFGLAFWLCVVYDPNVRTSLEWGLETMLGPMIVFLSVNALAKAFTPGGSRRAILLFYIYAFLAFIIRPESFAFIMAAGLPFLLCKKETRSIAIKNLVFFALFFVAYLAGKYLLFGDILPTGFYRKIAGGSGYAYVWEWITTYRFAIILLLILCFISTLIAVRKHLWDRSIYWVFSLFGIPVLTLIFFTQTNPLVGVGYRFLMTPIFVLYFFICLLIFWLFDQLSKVLITKVFYWVVLVSAIAYFAVIYASSVKGADFWDTVNIYHKAIVTTGEQAYLKFGGYLRNSIPNPEDITLVFGDAGAIPYSFGGRFIDSNGLTEPALAHLFQLPDGPEKTTRYVDYILSQHPDIVVLAWGNTKENGEWRPPVNPHSPFNGEIPMEVYKSYKEYGIVYYCSLKLHYDLHIGLSIRSDHFSELEKVLSTYCNENGYTLPNGLIVSNDSQTVTFPRAP